MTQNSRQRTTRRRQTPVPGCRSDTSIRSTIMSETTIGGQIVSHRSDVCSGYLVTQANARNATITAPTATSNIDAPPPRSFRSQRAISERCAVGETLRLPLHPSYEGASPDGLSGRASYPSPPRLGRDDLIDGLRRDCDFGRIDRLPDAGRLYPKAIH